MSLRRNWSTGIYLTYPGPIWIPTTAITSKRVMMVHAVTSPAFVPILGLPNEWTGWGCLALVSVYARTNLDWGRSSRLTYLAGTLSRPCYYLSRRHQTSLWPPDNLMFLIRSYRRSAGYGVPLHAGSDVITVQFRWTYVEHGVPWTGVLWTWGHPSIIITATDILESAHVMCGLTTRLCNFSVHSGRRSVSKHRSYL